MKTYLHKYWKGKVSEIKKMELTESQAEDIRAACVSRLGDDLLQKKISHSEFDKFCADIKLALYCAINLYEKNYKKWYERIPFFKSLILSLKTS